MENIQVIVRVRPSNQQERSEHDLEIWSVKDETIAISADRYADLVRMRKFLPSQRVEFNFNQCFDQRNNTQMIYQQQIRRITISALQGINGTVFMYGQTGSGKTFTMMGPHGIEAQTQPSQSHSKTNSLLTTNSVVSATPKNLLKELPPPNKGMLATQPQPPRRNNSHRSPSHRTKDKTPQRQESTGQITDTETPDKLGLAVKRSQENFKQLQFESELDKSNQDGLLVLALQDLFQEIEKQQDKQFLLRCSYVEIYTDQVFDLLKFSTEKLIETLSINEDHNKEFYIKGANEEIVTSIDDIMEIVRKGENNRHYASTIMNHVSSRSHTIFRLYVKCIPNDMESAPVITESILNFVDLAGSEKINIHDSMIKKRGQSVSTNGGIQGVINTNNQSNFKDRTTESKHINKSLFYLTQVISLRSQGQKDQHIPYRNSPLTKILRSSLGGNSRTVVVLCVNPCYSQFEQTLSTLRFGQNAKQIKNTVTKNILNCDNEEALNKIINDYERKFNDQNSKYEHLQKVIEKLREEREQLLKNKQNAIVTSESERNSSSSSCVESISKRETNLLSQIQLYEEKITLLQKQMDDQNTKKNELIQQTIKLEKKYSRNKKKLQNQKIKIQNIEDENRKLKIICALHHCQIPIESLSLLDTSTLDKVSNNNMILYQQIVKAKLYKEMLLLYSEGNDNPSRFEALKIKNDPMGLFQYPKLFFEATQSKDFAYFEEDLSVQMPLPQSDDEVTNLNLIQSKYCSAPTADQLLEWDSFQTYFHKQSNSTSEKLLPHQWELIERQLAMLKSDYEIMKLSPSQVDNTEFQQQPAIRNAREDVQTSIQSIQAFKEPASHFTQYNILQLQEKQLNQYEELLNFQQQLHASKSIQQQSFFTGKENNLPTQNQQINLSTKNNSPPCVDDEANFQNYFENMDRRRFGRAEY